MLRSAGRQRRRHCPPAFPGAHSPSRERHSTRLHPDWHAFAVEGTFDQAAEFAQSTWRVALAWAIHAETQAPMTRSTHRLPAGSGGGVAPAGTDNDRVCIGGRKPALLARLVPRWLHARNANQAIAKHACRQWRREATQRRSCLTASSRRSPLVSSGYAFWNPTSSCGHAGGPPDTPS